ncbi:MAG: sigma-70 family RNA polymerase sigma factor [Phycisphaerae bacterium]|nr:sigma-70 family RNA polymerase sigma factor [Phycisphaerae bacterium]
MNTEHETTSSRIARVRAGDTQALVAAFDEYRLRLAKIAFFRLDQRLAGRLDPDDVLQEAYISAAQRCAHVEGDTESALFIWLRLIVVQTLVDMHRRHLGAQMRDAGREIPLHQRSPSESTCLSMTRYLAASVTSPSLAMRRSEFSEQLHHALDRMDPLDREVLALRHFEELTNQEIAEVLGIQQKAASIRYVRALRRLKAILDEVSGVNPWT